MSKASPEDLNSVLRAFQPFLKSVDIRTIAVRPETDVDWKNLVSSIIVSERTVEEVREEYEKLPKLKNKQVALFLFAAPFDYSIFEQFAHGYIVRNRVMISKSGVAHGKLTITSRPFNPLALRMRSTQKNVRGVVKYVLQAIDSGLKEERESLWKVVERQDNAAKRLNYTNMMELIKDVLQIELGGRDRKDFQFIISDIADIRNVTFDESSFQVEISKISGLKDLQLNVTQKRATRGSNFYTVWREIVPVDKVKPQSRGIRSTSIVDVQPPDLLPFDLITLSLIHRDSALTLDEDWLRTPLQNVVDPFFKVLDSFCAIDEFKKMLLEPENCGKDPAKRFEIAITWLLSLAGFHTIYLGAKTKATQRRSLIAHDVLRAESGYHIGGADIIAYEDNERILLIDCDIGPLEDKKIEKLIETRDHFQTLLDFGELKIVPVLCSPKHFREPTEDKRVAIVDGDVIETILGEIAKGDRESARSAIFYPW
jgi:hypothetical protein